MSQAEKKVSTQLAVSQTALLLISEASIHFFLLSCRSFVAVSSHGIKVLF